MFASNFTTDNGNFSSPSTYQYGAVAWLFHITIPLFCISGLLGNVLGILVLQICPNLRHLPIAALLTSLAGSSSVFLTTAFLQWLGHSFPILSFYQYSDVGCKLMSYVSYVSDFTCAWIVTLICLDRVVLMANATVHKRVSSVMNSWIAVAVVTLFNLAHFSWTLYGAESRVSGPSIYRKCVSKDEQWIPHINALSTMLGIGIPLTGTLFGTLYIVYKIRKLRSYLNSENQRNISPNVKFTRYTLMSKTATPEPPNILDQNGEVNEVTFTHNNSRLSVMSDAKQEKMHGINMRRCDYKMTVRILTSLGVFLCLEAPQYAEKIIFSVISPGHKNGTFLVVVAFLFYFYHAILSYVYIFVNRHIRKQVRPTLRYIKELSYYYVCKCKTKVCCD